MIICGTVLFNSDHAITKASRSYHNKSPIVIAVIVCYYILTLSVFYILYKDQLFFRFLTSPIHTLSNFDIELVK